MSLLNDLLFYSSVNGRQERSSSTFAKLEVDNYRGQQKKLERASKSLTKLSCWQASNSKLDPKQKIIYKIIHRLSVKLKKHYYLFFINLQFTENKKQQLPEKKLDKIKTGIIKLQQSIDFIFSKYYVNNSKDKYFLAIRQYGLNNFVIKKITNGFNQHKKRIFFQKLIQNYQSYKNYQLKVQIFIDSIKNFQNSYLFRNFCFFKQQLLLKVKAIDLKKPKIYIIENIVEEEFESCSQGIQTPKNLNTKIEILRHFQQITEREQIKFDKQVKLQNNTKLINSFERRKNSKSRQKEQMIKKPILLNFFQQKKANFIIQKPIIIRENKECIPKQMIKIRYDIYQNSIPDLQDQSEIFRQPFSDYVFHKNFFQPTSETFRSYTQHQKESRLKTNFGQIFSINEDEKNCPRVPKILQKCLTKRKIIPNYYGIEFNPQAINSQEGFFSKSSIKEPVCFKNSLITERQNSLREDCYQEKNGKWKKHQSQVDYQFLQKQNHSKLRPTQQYRPLNPYIASNSFKKKSSSFSERQTSTNDRFYLHTIPLINMSGIVDNHKPVKDLQNYRSTNYQTFLNSADKYLNR